MKFWDASAIVPLLHNEAESDRMRKLWREDSSAWVWWATEIECVSAVARRERMAPAQGAVLSAQAIGLLSGFAASWEVVAPSAEIKSIAVRLVRVHPLSAADALQLAAAIVVADGRPQGNAFVTLDARLHLAAEKEGFTVPLQPSL